MKPNPVEMPCYDLLLREHFEQLHHAIGMLVLDKELGEEIFQQTIIQGWNKFADFREEGRFFSWMLSIAYSVRANIFQKMNRLDNNNRRVFQDCAASAVRLAESFDPERQVLKEEEKQVAHDALAHVKEKDRIYYVLRHEDDLSIPKIAKKCCVSEGAVKRGLARAQKILDGKIKRLIAAYLSLELFRGNTRAIASDAMQKVAGTPPEQQVAAGTTIGFFASLLPFVLMVVNSCWLLALHLGGLLCGAAVVRDAPTLYARRWLITRILHCYVGLLAVPFIFGLLDVLYRFHLIHGNAAMIGLLVVAVTGAAALIFVIRLVVAYRRVCRRTETGPMETDEAYLRLERYVRRGLRLCVLLIFVTTVFYGCGLVLDFHQVIIVPSRNIELFAGLALIAALWVTGFTTLHVCVSKYFRFFLKVSENEEAFRSYMCLNADESRKRTLHEIFCLAPFAIYTVFLDIYHLVCVQTRIVYSIFELILFVGMWFWVLGRNQNTASGRWKRILAVFVIQVAIVILTRAYFRL